MYEAIRQKCAELLSAQSKARIGSKNGAYGSRWICNTELKLNRKLPSGVDVPSGWEPGRSVWNKIAKRDSKVSNLLRAVNSAKTKRAVSLSICEKYYELYAKEGISSRDFVRKYGLAISHVTMLKYFKLVSSRIGSRQDTVNVPE